MTHTIDRSAPPDTPALSASVQELAIMGDGLVAYVRPVPMPDGSVPFGIFSAVGVQLAMAEDAETACTMARMNGLEPVRVA